MHARAHASTALPNARPGVAEAFAAPKADPDATEAAAVATAVLDQAFWYVEPQSRVSVNVEWT